LLSRKKRGREPQSFDKGAESELIRALREKKTWAYERLYDQYAGLIGSIAKSYLNSDDVEDVIQEAFLRVYKSIKNFKGDSSFTTWLYRIAVNVCKDQLKRYAKRSETMTNFEDEDSSISEPAGDQNVELSAEKELDAEDVNSILRRLSEDDQELIRLRDVQDLDYEEISEIVDKPLGTVKSRIHYARKRLKKLLSVYYGERAEDNQGGKE
jgi:RNA polymerase sigma-70 factor (ECF subfamily)